MILYLYLVSLLKELSRRLVAFLGSLVVGMIIYLEVYSVAGYLPSGLGIYSRSLPVVSFLIIMAFLVLNIMFKKGRT